LLVKGRNLIIGCGKLLGEMPYILVIAKDRLIRSFIGAQLKEEGYEVTGAAAISEAVH
jgi:CheY-like chemotaxis protein